ncbi:MAG: HD-GYP domain-containing protein [Lachnospiraceae bacterium]|nr:HD-GYP domain-containing protein [Lachnospiraceae bacterium]
MRTLKPKQLEEGMKTANPVKTPLGQILAPEDTIITRQLINKIKLYRVESVDVEGDAPEIDIPELNPVPAAPVAPAKPAPAQTHAQQSRTHTQKVASSSEFQTFQLQYLQAIEVLKETFESATIKSAPIDPQFLLNSVSELFRSRSTISELFDMLYNMRTINDSVYSHCLNVALISRMIGRWLRLDSHDWDILTVAGLLHDIGKIRIPEKILNKPGSLTDEEFALIKQHPQLGYDILKDQPNLDVRIKNAALMHHERCDGSGYPSHLKGEEIDKCAMILAIADVYDAMTAARSYRSPLCPFQVISNFEQDGFQKYQTKYILTFLNHIASTYQNNRVLLSDGRSCNIVMLNQNALSRPIVQFDDNTCLDLSRESRDLYIKAVL